MNSLKQILITLLLTCSIPSRSLGQEPIQWSFAYESNSPAVVIVRATATLAPRWHIYSQYLQEGGPSPTKITFEQNGLLQPLGDPGENGLGVSFYDSLYGMNITWYSKKVTFTQPVKHLCSASEIKGSITYMICNDHQCIPGSTTFQLPARILRRAP